MDVLHKAKHGVADKLRGSVNIRVGFIEQDHLGVKKIIKNVVGKHRVRQDADDGDRDKPFKPSFWLNQRLADELKVKPKQYKT